MKNKIRQNKIKLFLVLIVSVILVFNFSYAETFDKNSVYKIINPKTRATVICKGDGTIIMKTMNGTNDFLELLYDVRTNKPVVIQKRIEGETKDDRQEYDQNGNLLYEYSYPSYRTELYDINGKKLGFNEKNVSYISFVIGKKIIYYKDVDGEENRHFFMYDIDTGKETKGEYPTIDNIDGKCLVMSHYSYSDKDKQKIMKICDYDFNEIKTLPDYSYESTMYIDGKQFLRVNRYKIINGKKEMFYNVLDENYNFIFDEDLENGIYPEENHIATINGKTRKVVYDFKNMKMIEDEKKEVDKEKDVAREIANKENYMTLGDMYYKQDGEKKETSVYDDKLNLIKKFDKNYNYIGEYTYEDKKLYMADSSYYDEKNDKYIEQNDLYDEDFNLKMNCKRIDIFIEDGKFIKDGVVYDFSFNELKKLDDIKNDRFYIYKLKNKTYYANNMTEDYNAKEKYNIYDNNFNIIHSDVKHIDFYSFKDKYLIIKDDKTIAYDIDDKKCEELSEPYELYMGYKEKYYTIHNIKTDRYGVMDENFNILLSNYKNITDVKDDYCTFQNGFKYGLTDYNGNVLVSFSIFDTMSEDTKNDVEIFY